MSIVLTAPFIPGYSDIVLEDNPTSYWRLGEASGNFIDSIANAYPATPVGTITREVTGLISNDSDKAISIVGTGYASIASGASVSVFGSHSMEAWINPSAIGNQMVIYGENGSGGLISGILVEADGTAGFVIWISGTWYTALSSVVLSAGTRYHIVGTMHPVDGMVVYVDGVADGTDPNVLVHTGVVGETIGRDGNNFVPYSGVIDEVAVYKTTLSAPRVSDHYDAGV